MTTNCNDCFDDFGEWKPGKLRTRAKKSRKVAQSFMELPAVDNLNENPQIGIISEKVDQNTISSEIGKINNDSDNLTPNITPNDTTTSIQDTNTNTNDNNQDPFETLLHDSNDEDPEIAPRQSLSILLKKNSEEKTKNLTNNNTPILTSPIPTQKQQTHHNYNADCEHLQALLAQAETLTRNLNENILAIRQAQNKIEKRNILNSAVAYVIFCIIITLGLYLALNSKAGMITYKNKFDDESFRNLQTNYQITKKELDKNQKASHASYEVYQLIEQSRFDEAVNRFNEVRAEVSHPAELALLDEKIDTVRWKLAENAYRDGLALYLEGNFAQARDFFTKSVSYKNITPYTHLLHFYLAISLFNLGDFEGARAYLEESLKTELPSELDPTARYHLAVATEKIGDSENAYALYENFLKKYRYHKLSEDAAKRQQKLDVKNKKN